MGNKLSENLPFREVLEIFKRPAKGKPFDPNDPEWKKIRHVKNLISNIGYNCVADRIFDSSGTYTSTNFGYFAWSDGTTNPALADTSTTFYADGSNNDTKAITSYESFDVGNKKQMVNCFLSSSNNAVASISKFAIMNDDPGTIMFTSVKFDAISKTSSKEFFFRYSLIMSQS